jgi:hypothetical protein
VAEPSIPELLPLLLSMPPPLSPKPLPLLLAPAVENMRWLLLLPKAARDS